jgi:tetratricopeptide (TPR) repeat protein
MNAQRHRNTITPLLAACALLALTSMGGCSGSDKAAPGSGPAGERPATGKPQTPYYYGIIEEYRNVLAEDPHNLAAVIGLANALYDAGQWKQAIQYYERALRLNPHMTDVITDMGTCYRNLGAPDKAIELYEQALKMEPAHQNALFNMGVVYGFDKKDYEHAVTYWDKLLHVAPKHPQADFLQANIAQFRKAMRGGGRK